MSTYAHPHSLVTTAWLAAHLNDPDIRLLDGSFTMPGVTPTARENYLRRHIPGAVFFDIDEVADHANPLPHMLPSAADFAEHMARLGVGDEHQIVVYDDGTILSAPRVWWMLRSFGHHQVALLDGGLARWCAEDRPVTALVPQPTRAVFNARFDGRLLRDRASLRANLESHSEQVIDARAAARFAGTAPEPRPGLRSGHIPGSLNLPWNRLIDPETRRWLPAPALIERYRDAGVDPDKPVICSCGSGVSACALAFGLHLIGWPEAAIYDGSWSEWGASGDMPVETALPTS